MGMTTYAIEYQVNDSAMRYHYVEAPDPQTAMRKAQTELDARYNDRSKSAKPGSSKSAPSPVKVWGATSEDDIGTMTPES